MNSKDVNFKTTSQKLENRSGLSQLSYRITDYNASRKGLLSLLRDSLRPDQGNQEGPLFRLTTRDNDDAAIALIDAWSVLADVLTFYQERIANEGYLRTATERRSVLELARMIGYELNPGVAASTYFAFTVEDAPGSPEIATIPKGTQVMSIPGEDELPQTFETSEEFVARVDWNNLKPRSSRPQQITKDTTQLYIEGVTTRLQAGDFLLLVEQLDESPIGRKYLLSLKKVETNASAGYTVVHAEKLLLKDNSPSENQTQTPLQNPQLFAFRQQAFLYGYNNSQSNPQPSDSNQIKLNAPYPQIIKESWIFLHNTDLVNPSYEVYQVTQTAVVSQSETISLPDDKSFTQFVELTQLKLMPARGTTLEPRKTIVLVQSELLKLAPEPLIVSDRQTDIFQDPIQGKTIFLNEFIQKLYRNQILIVSGQRIRAQLNNAGGVFYSEVKSILWNRSNEGFTNTQIRALIRSSPETTLLAGTTDGIFRSQDNGQHWEPIVGWASFSKSLEQKEIQVLQRTQDNSLLVGTADGLIRSTDEGATWQKIELGLTYSDIRAIHPYLSNQILVGTINGGVFRSSDEGSPWRATGLNNTDVQSLTRYPKADPSATLPYTFAGTIRDGIFRCTDPDLLTWQQITDTRLGTGTITTEGAVVTGQNTNFNAPLKQVKYGDIINVGGQSRTVLVIESDEQLIVDRPFRPDLTASTSFTINTGLTNRNITALATKDKFVFAGTAGSGVFRSSTEPDVSDHDTRQLGDRWVAVNTGLTDLEIRCLVVADNGDIWVGTSKAGVFRSTNNGDSWEPVNTHLTNLDVRAILLPTRNSPHFFVGGIGILQPLEDGAYPKPVQRGDVLQILEPPAAISNQPDYYQWKLMDKDGFQGKFITTTALDNPEFKNEITLLPALEDSEVVSELAVIQNPPTDQQQPILTLQKPLQYAYDSATVQIFANVVPGTHGETVEEVLGSGDGHLPNQQFVLKKPPLTYVPAPNARGSESTLGVRVNRVLWQEAPSLYPLESYDQNYIVRIQDDGTTIVTFGDGTKGARLPSGLENITATYRSGIGLDGNLKAQQLSLLKTRPLGISEVINPLPATGGAPRESLTEAQVNAPATVRTLDRIVSIRDFGDFTQGFAGIGKAQAVPLWNGETQIVHITVAGVQGNDVLKDSNLYIKLVEAIDNARDPIQQVQIDSYERLSFNLEARLLLDPRYETKVVAEKILETLKTTFAFLKRKFGQEVTAAEVIAAIQSVAGVIAVDLDALYQVGQSKVLARSLPALSARYDAQTGAIHPAQLLRLNPEGIQIKIVPTL